MPVRPERLRNRREAFARGTAIEPRWPVVTTILLVLYLLAMMPGRIRLFSPWQVGIGGLEVIIPGAGVGLVRGRRGWLLLGRAAVRGFVLSAGVAAIVHLSNLIRAIH